MRPFDKWQSDDAVQYTRERIKDTACHKLLMLNSTAVLRLFTEHLELRAGTQEVAPVALTQAAHKLLQIASDQERSQMRKVAS